jgi:hypothetical protein
VPCGFVALSFAGDRYLAAGAAPHLHGYDPRGELRITLDLEQPPTALAMSALGERAFVGQSNGKLHAIKLPPV